MADWDAQFEARTKQRKREEAAAADAARTQESNRQSHWEKLQDIGRWALAKYQKSDIDPTPVYVAQYRTPASFLGDVFGIKSKWIYRPLGHGYVLTTWDETCTNAWDNSYFVYNALMVSPGGELFYTSRSQADGSLPSQDRWCGHHPVGNETSRIPFQLHSASLFDDIVRTVEAALSIA